MKNANAPAAGAFVVNGKISQFPEIPKRIGSIGIEEKRECNTNEVKLC